MIVVDKQALTRFARAMMAQAAIFGVKARYSAFLEGACAALGLPSVNAATALLRERSLVIGVPRWVNPLGETGLYFGFSSVGDALYRIEDEQLAAHVARFVIACGTPDKPNAAAKARLNGLATSRTVLQDWEKGSLVTPDVALAVDRMGMAAGTRVAGLAGTPDPAEDWENHAIWGRIVANALKQGVLASHAVTVAEEMYQAIALQVLRAESRGAIHGGLWSHADDAAANMLRVMGHTAAPGITRVATEIRLPDDMGRKEFDAVPFLMGAEVSDIQALHACHWRPSDAASSVASFVEHLPGYEEVGDMVMWALVNDYGFDVTVDEDEAVAWLRENRPMAYAALHSPVRRQPGTASELVERIEAIGREAAGSYGDFRDLAIRFLDSLDSHSPDDETWNAVEDLVRHPETDDIGWILEKARSLSAQGVHPGPSHI